MRITRDLLLNYARESTLKMTSKDRGIVCVYLVGSLLRQDCFIGGLTDIDLVCVHDRPIAARREIVRINGDIHLDIAHYVQDDFLPARKLRTDPWIGGALDNGTVLLYDITHWLDLIRSTAISQYWQSANTAARVNTYVASARQNWASLSEGSIPQGIKRTQALLDAIRDTANATACLNGMPLPTRRLFMDLPARAAEAGIPEIAGDLVQMFAVEEALDEENWELWLANWSTAFNAMPAVKDPPPAYLPIRRSYYQKAIEDLTEEKPAAALWILLHTWTRMASLLPKTDPSYKEWQTMTRQLGLDTKNIPDHLEQLDAALERVEIAVEALQG